MRHIFIDKGIYEADDRFKTYRFLKRNPDWKKLIATENEKNKQSIDGYTRIFRNGNRKKFVRNEHL